MSRLEPYRKLAKQLVRWHRAGNYSVGGRIRNLPRYRNLDDAFDMLAKMGFIERRPAAGDGAEAMAH